MTDSTLKNAINAVATAMGFTEQPTPRFSPQQDDHEPDFVDLEQMEAEDGEEEHGGNSVVASEYKAKYRERADNMARKPKDISKKVLRRCNSDWLAIELARLTVDPKGHADVDAFTAILDANGVKHSHWKREGRGWQGRIRMTGRLALQRVVAENDGELALPDGTALKAPRTWVAKHVH